MFMHPSTSPLPLTFLAIEQVYPAGFPGEPISPFRWLSPREPLSARGQVLRQDMAVFCPRCPMLLFSVRVSLGGLSKLSPSAVVNKIEV